MNARSYISRSGLFSAGFAIVATALGCAGAPPRKPADLGEQPVKHTWASTSWEDRHTTMTFTVLPNMGQLWQKFTKSDAPTLTCRTCHGEDAEEVKYRMPNPALPPLDPKHLPSASSSDANEARWAKFMRDEVVPHMTGMLDTEPYDPKTGRGFFCFNCHTEKKS